MAEAVPPPSERDFDAERDAARAALARGDMAAAIEQQSILVADLQDTQRVTIDDFLFLGLMQHQHGRMEDALVTMGDALHLFPEEPALHENHAVLLLSTGDTAGAITACRRALEFGSESPNVYDCLTDASGRIGRMDQAVLYGRESLEAKDRLFTSRPPLVRVPDSLPPAFNPALPAENVIAYCLWGGDRRYVIPLMENLRILNHLFPEWSVRVYLDLSVPPDVRTELERLGAQLILKVQPPSQPGPRKLLWRFDVLSDPTVRRFLIRDADSLLTVKERVAVDAWLASRYHFHTMRDFYTHTDVLLAGMWGGVGGILPGPDALLAAYSGWRVEGDHVDQDLLSETVWPSIRNHTLIHDSVFTGCLGSVEFPPFGALPQGHHIGQNAFIHFQSAG